MKNMKRLNLCLLLSVTACERGGEYRLGVDLSTLEFNYYSPQMGVHPDASVLEDPNNLFSDGMTSETKWVLEAEKDRPGHTVACFYAWATELAYDPQGEHQYYTAAALHDMYLRQESEPGDIYSVRDLAIDGYQALLDHFPGSVSYLADGATTFDLEPLACQAIVDLGGTPEGDCDSLDDGELGSE
jgi:hypothetical protein